MIDTLKTIWHNLSKIQKIGLIVVIQALIIMLIVVILNLSLGHRDHIEIEDETGVLSSMPTAEKELYEDALWEVISDHIDNLDRSVVKEATIREDSYTEEIDSENGVTSVSFLIDIDSIRQTYKVRAGWTKKEPFTVDPVIECVSVNESKYPDSVCYGTYNSTCSLDLYLPYQIDSPYKEEFEYAGPDVYIYGDEFARVITVSLNPCNNIEENKKKANDYLQIIPNLNDYQVEYKIKDGIDAVCAEDL